MAQLRQTQLWDTDTQGFQLLPRSERPTFTTYNSGSGVPVGGFVTNQDGVWVGATGTDQFCRFQIIQTERNSFAFRPGTIIQVVQTPSTSHPLYNSGARAIIVRNSKISTTADAANNQIYSVTLPGGGTQNYDTRDLSDVTILPLEGTATAWASLCQTFDANDNGQIRRASSVDQESFGNLLRYTDEFDTAAIHAITLGDTPYNQGDGQSNRFVRDHNFEIASGGGLRFTHTNINIGFPRTTDGADPLLNESNWVHENDAADGRPRYQAESRNFINAVSSASPNALDPFVNLGGIVNFIGTDFVNNVSQDKAGDGANQTISFANGAREFINSSTNNDLRLSLGSSASAYEGYWTQSTTASNGQPSEFADLQDFITSNNFFDTDLSGINATPQRFMTQRSIDLFYYGTQMQNEGQPVILRVPEQSSLNMAVAAGSLHVDFRTVPGYIEPDLTLPVFVLDASDSKFAECTFQFSRPGRDQDFSSLLRFNDVPHVTDTDIIFDNTSTDSRVEIDGRTVANHVGASQPVFDFVTISDAQTTPTASHPDFIVTDCHAGLDFPIYGLSCKAVEMMPAFVNGNPVPSADTQRIRLIDPATNITKPYNASATQFGNVTVSRNLVGTISNGKTDTTNTNIFVHRATDTQHQWLVDNQGMITEGTLTGATTALYSKDDDNITLTDGDATYPPQTHPYKVQLLQYEMPSENTANRFEVHTQNRYRIAITEPGCIPFVRDDLDVGGAMQELTQVDTLLSPRDTDNRPTYNREGINQADIGIGNISLLQDIQFPLDFDFSDYQMPNDTDPLTSLYDFYTGLHLFSVFRQDADGALAGDQLAAVDYSDDYLEILSVAGGGITITPENSQATTWTEADTDRHGYGKISWDPTARIIRVNSGTVSGAAGTFNTPFIPTPPQGEIDIKGIKFQGVAGTINARNQGINIGVTNAIITNTGNNNGGRYNNVTFMMAPGDYTFNGAEFGGDLSNIVFENTMGTSGGAVNISFRGAASNIPNAGSFTTRGTVNFPDTRTLLFPQAGQVVLSRPSSTSPTGFEVVSVGGNTTSHLTVESTVEGREVYSLTLPDAVVPIGTHLNIYYKPYDTFGPDIPFADRDRFRWHLVNFEYEWTVAQQGANVFVTDEASFDITRQFDEVENLGMGTTIDDQYVPPAGRFTWDFYDGSSTSTNSQNGARLQINLHGAGASGANTTLNSGQTKQFLYWMMERQDLNRSGQNHFLEAVAAIGHPVNHTITDNTALPIRFFETSAFVDTRVLTVAKFANTDPLNSFTGLAPVPLDPARAASMGMPAGPGQNAVYAIHRFNARNSANAYPNAGNSATGSHANTRDLYLIDETREVGNPGTVIRGVPDIDNQLPVDGITEFQVTQAALAAIDRSQANNILHWHADGLSSKIPVGRTYNPSIDYSEN